mmetsp:Transcript_9967/g.13046  ORF Transcript_9967/g.13046 Transcript_9967/m.13046 type:complete len:596 (-) Transcript_9967:256-2043(-)
MDFHGKSGVGEGSSQILAQNPAGQPIFRRETISVKNSLTPVIAQSQTQLTTLRGQILPEQFANSPVKSEQASPQALQSQPQLEQKVQPPPVKKKRNVPTPAFLTKCYDIFSREEHADICGWGDKGDTILVHQPHRFAVEILPKYFKHANFQSFVRQLNMYNFTKTNPDPLIIEFKQIYFRKGRHDLLPLIKRRSPAQGGLMAALARARKGASQFEHPKAFELPRIPEPTVSHAQARSDALLKSEPPLASIDETGPLSNSPSSTGPGSGSEKDVAPPLATLSEVLMDGARQELSQQSDSLLHDLVHLLRWQKRMERRVQALESETKSLHGENTMLWNMVHQRAQQQDGMKDKMRDILLLMHRAFRAGEQAQQQHRKASATQPQPGAPITKTASQLISEMSQIDFERNVKELGINAPSLISTPAQLAESAAANLKRKQEGQVAIPPSSDPKRLCILPRPASAAASNLVESVPVAGMGATAGQQAGSARPDPRQFNTLKEEEKEELIDNFFQMQNVEEETITRLDSLGIGLEHLLSFDQGDLTNLLRTESVDNPAEILERYHSLDLLRKDSKQEEQVAPVTSHGGNTKSSAESSEKYK